MTERLVIIGGDAAGLSTATNARRSRPSEDLEIVVFERGDWVSYSACGEPYFVSGIVPEITDLLALPVEEFARRDIHVRRRCEVNAIDTAGQTVTVRDAEAGRDEIVSYDQLMYATGASPREIPLEGMHLRNVFQMHTLDDALAARAVVEQGVSRAVIVGGGYIGLEMAEAFQHRGIETTIVEAGDVILPGTFDPEFSVQLLDAIRQLGIHVVLGERIACLGDAEGRVRSVGCGDDEIPADIVIVAVGTVPNVDLARAAGIRIGESGGVWVDDHQRTDVQNVWSAGDCAEATHRLSGRLVNIHLGTYANRQGRIAGLNVGGGDVVFPGVLGTAISKVMEIELARTGLTASEAEALGRTTVVAEFDSRTGAGYWPDASRMRIRAVAEQGSRRLIGAQVFGGRGAGKRIDARAMASWKERTGDDMVNADLSYAPPFSGVWDPVLVAARQLQEAMDN